MITKYVCNENTINISNNINDVSVNIIGEYAFSNNNLKYFYNYGATSLDWLLVIFGNNS